VTAHPFIPRNTPKSFIVAILGGLSGLASGGIAFFGHYLGSTLLLDGGRVLFGLCALVTLPMMAVFLINKLLGKYTQIVERPWDEQVW
jgi:hypothetical protein